jgi:hypothetical protein
MSAMVMIGCDPETFITRKDGKFISAAGLFPGTKKEPHPLECGAVQVDGVALEYNINPAKDEDEFARFNSIVLSQLNELVHKILDKDHFLNFTPVARFDADEWEKTPAESKILGCDPDYNFEGEVNVNPTDLLEGSSLRTAAGHVHIGWTRVSDPKDARHFADCRYIARKFFEAKPEFYVPTSKVEIERLKYYGGHASWRPKTYGVELRSPSNIWVASEDSRRKMYNVTRTLFKKFTGM